MKKLGKNYYTALCRKYEAEMAEASANLETYFENTTGIGEHSDILPEFDKWVEQYTNAKDKLESLKELFTEKV